jgi:hypothetical protein
MTTPVEMWQDDRLRELWMRNCTLSALVQHLFTLPPTWNPFRESHCRPLHAGNGFRDADSSSQQTAPHRVDLTACSLHSAERRDLVVASANA